MRIKVYTKLGRRLKHENIIEVKFSSKTKYRVNHDYIKELMSNK